MCLSLLMIAAAIIHIFKLLMKAFYSKLKDRGQNLTMRRAFKGGAKPKIGNLYI